MRNRIQKVINRLYEQSDRHQILGFDIGATERYSSWCLGAYGAQGLSLESAPVSNFNALKLVTSVKVAAAHRRPPGASAIQNRAGAFFVHGSAPT
jgi:hypothetical protein